MKNLLIFIFFCLVTIPSHTKELISSIKIKNNSITYRVDKHLRKNYLREDFFVTYHEDINLKELDYTIITMPLIMNIISVVWISGKDYSIEAMDKELFESLEVVKEIFKRFYPKTSFNGNLIPRTLVDNSLIWQTKNSTIGIALPFSHGLDSLCTSLRLRSTPQLLITARGMPDTPLDDYDPNWQATQDLVHHYAQVHGHTNTFITSNFHEFFNWRVLSEISPEIKHWRICMVESLGWMGLAAPLLISKGYREFVLPANDDWESKHPGAGCPLIDESVRFAGITNTCDGFHLPRLEKNKVIADICNEHGIEKPFSMICENILLGRKNCCECQKCVASILSLLLIGENPAEYGFIINISDFIDFVKTEFFLDNTFGHHSFRTFQYCQTLANETMQNLDDQLQEFFTWYCSVDLSEYATPHSRSTLNYNDFIDLYDNIPQEVLERHRIKT